MINFKLKDTIMFIIEKAIVWKITFWDIPVFTHKWLFGTITV